MLKQLRHLTGSRPLDSPRPARSAGALAAALMLLLPACGQASEPAPEESPTVQPLAIDWAQLGSSVESGAWRVTVCTEDVRLCVFRDDEPAGWILMEDLPSLGQEAAFSADQIQATLAVRTNTLYQSWAKQRTEQCGPDVFTETDRPTPVPVAQGVGLKYGVAASIEGRMVERTIGYRTFRTPIETIVEATAIAPEGCVDPLDGGFTVEHLEQFEELFDRIAAGSKLPAPVGFESTPSGQPGSSEDPRKAFVPSAGLGIEHRSSKPEQGG